MDRKELEFEILGIKVEKVQSSKRVLRFKGSDATLDRDDEILTVGGWDLKNYKKNPVFLWAHKYGNPPIGRANKVFIRKEEGLMFDILFAEKETYEFADTIYKLYEQEFLNATSVGFRPEKGTRTWNEDDGILTTPKKELWELSAVPVPANPNALIERSVEDAMQKNVINKTQHDRFLKELDKLRGNQSSIIITEKTTDHDVGDEILFDFEKEKGKKPEKTPADPPESQEPEKPGEKPTNHDMIPNNIYEAFKNIKAFKAPEKEKPIESNLINEFKALPLEVKK